MNFKLYFSLLVFGIFFFSCDSDKGKDIPDVSHIEVDVKINRFEQDLFNLDTTQMEIALANLQEKHPEFSRVFFNQILGSTDKRIAPQGHENYVKGFINFPSVRHLHDTVQIVYPDLTQIEQEFAQAFRFFKYYFPEREIPDVTTFISELTIGGFIYAENSLAVGLDFFLGEGYPYATYNPGNPNFSQYLTRTFNKDHLVLKTLIPLIEDAEILGIPSGNRLIDAMVHNGKKLYILDKLLPNAPDSVKLEMTPTQVEWLKNNEFQMWAHFIKEDLLYSTDVRKTQKLVSYSPHSPGMPPEAPGRTANWIGLKIIESYMKRYPETTLQEMLDMQDAQEILTKSKYKPR